MDKRMVVLFRGLFLAFFLLGCVTGCVGKLQDYKPKSNAESELKKTLIDFQKAFNKEDLNALANEAFEDPCHATNMVPVTRDDLLSTYEAAL